MWVLAALFAAGALAELIDGSLGMGFGVTNTSFLLTLGLAPAAASASVHVAEVATSFANGASHLKFGNVDRATLPWLAVPGCVGGVMGAALLAGVDAAWSRPVVSAVLLVMGALILYRALRARAAKARATSRGRVAAIGFAAAAVDAFGGGGWGPIATPGLILSEGHEPRKAVGTVNLAEFFVTVAITITFFLVLGAASVRWDYVGAVAAGGVLLAPAAAYLSKRVPPRMLGEVVGALLVALNTRVIAVDFFHADARASAAVTLGFLLAVGLALFAKGLGRSGRPGPRGGPEPGADRTRM